MEFLHRLWPRRGSLSETLPFAATEKRPGIPEGFEARAQAYVDNINDTGRDYQLFLAVAGVRDNFRCTVQDLA